MSEKLLGRWDTKEGVEYKRLILLNASDEPKLRELADAFFGFNEDHIDYRGIVFSNVDIEGADFSYCDFSNGKFINVKLSQCFFDYSFLYDAFFEKVLFSKTSLSCSYCDRIKLKNCLIEGSSFGSAEAKKASFNEVKIVGGNFMSVDFSGANLSNVLFLGDVWLKSAILPLAAKEEIESQVEDCRNLERIKWV